MDALASHLIGIFSSIRRSVEFVTTAVPVRFVLMLATGGVSSTYTLMSR